MLSLLIMSPLCPCPAAKSDGARAPIVPGSAYQATVQAYRNEHYHNTGPAGISDAEKGNAKGELNKHDNTAPHNGVLTFPKLGYRRLMAF